MTHQAPKFVVYCRVSTKEQKQGHSLDAQEHVCREFVKNQGGRLLRVFSEVATASNDRRPEVQAAMRLARRSGATLVTAKLDRLSRNVSFVADVMNNGPRWQVVEHPDASVMELHMRAVFAEEERRKISERTRAGLAQAKRRGIKLGTDRPGSREAIKGGNPEALAFAREEAARRRHEANQDLYDEARGIIAETAELSLREVGKALESAGVLTPRGGEQWSATAVKRLRDRLAHRAKK